MISGERAILSVLVNGHLFVGTLADTVTTYRVRGERRGTKTNSRCSENSNPRMAAMLEPVILSEAILNQARLWRDECLRRWADADTFPRIGEETLSSPVDGSQRKVVLHVSKGLFEGGRPVKGKTAVGIFFDVGDIREGYTVVVNSEMIDRPDSLTPVLLHELTHALDPCFDDDFHMFNPPGAQGVRLTSEEQYDLSSEQRAFSAMWTEDLRIDLERGQYRNPGASALLYRQRSHEFDGFWCYGQLRKPELMQQTKEHFRQIIEDLRRR
jgi:hypothetical protein